MGDFRVRTINNAADRTNMFQHVLDDIQAFEIMLEENLFQSGNPQIGAEQEICIVDNQFLPATTNLQFLDKIDDPHYTNELALFNLEVNLDPHPLGGNCFDKVENDLLQLLDKGQKIASTFDNHLLLTGIMPTLKFRHLQFENMTPIPRYQAMSKVLSELRGDDFEIYIEGVDELNLSLESMLFEACNTSFQMHLQIDPAEFINQYNWSQMIAGPVLAIGANSPLLFGNELWAETRIAVFKQSIDSRSSSNQMRKKTPRVFFGEDWLRNSPVDVFKEGVARFPFILTSDDFDWSTKQLKEGKIPDLRAIKIHNGTTFNWNRICYGNADNQPHLRIECRYLPAGPSPIDEVANFAFWVGLMVGQPEEMKDFWKKTDFKTARSNFLKAARYGDQVTFDWFGEQLGIPQLILEKLLPIARKGLEKHQVASNDIDKYLSVIEKRVQKQTNGADWQVRNFRILQKEVSSAVALKKITEQTVVYQKENIPLHQWSDFKAGFNKHEKNIKATSVEELMTTDLFTVNEEDSVLAASTLLSWHPIAHLPVENNKGEIVGLLTDGLLQRTLAKNGTHNVLVKDIMVKSIITIRPEQSLTEAKKIMKEHKINALPVTTFQNKLLGMISSDNF